MNYMDDASTFEHSLLQKARQKHIPVTGALELLPLCNMNCDMCYVRLSRSEMERQGRLRTVEEWVRLAEQMQKAGTVFLLLTGGEPLLFPDFKTLYRRLRNLGMILTINTNGTLLDEAWADFLPHTRRAASTSRSMVPMPLPTTVCAIFRRASIRPFAQSGCSAHETWM
ncbi:MAG: radical SAM protein [Gallintestinimicrobium sp.]